MRAERFRVFISSPGDAMAERKRIERVVDRLNGEMAGHAQLEAVRWEKGFYGAHDTFQQQIPEAADCHVVVAVLRHRLGTELPADFPRQPDGTPYPSGTAYEMLSALEARRRNNDLPDLFVFRYTAPPVVRLDAAEERTDIERQWERLKAFFQRWFQTADGQFTAAFHPYDGIDNLEDQVDRLLRQWIERRQSRGRLLTWPIAVKGSPFCGLGAFGAKHAPVFFGRARDTTRAADGVRDAAARGTAFLLVIGPSGSGKSSLVRAGLVPHLTAPGAVPEVDVWRVASLRPGEHADGPFMALASKLFETAAALAPEEEGRSQALPELSAGAFGAPSDLAKLLVRGDDSAIRPILAALDHVAETERGEGSYDRTVTARLLLVIDQLDELFAADVSPTTRQRFADVLGHLAASGRVWVVATLRADFYLPAVSLPGLLALKSDGATFDLQPPGPAELAQIVRAPAAAADLVYEADAEGHRLDERVLADADQPDMLPLLQFTLNRLFEARAVTGGQTRLTHAAYDEMGGLDGAIDQEAEKALAPLGDQEIAALPRLLRALVTPAGDGEQRNRLTARSVRLDEIAADPPLQRLADALVVARVLLSDGTGEAASVRLAHERVLRSWRRARDLVTANAEFFRIRQEVEDARARWEASGRRRDRLIPQGIALEEARGIARQFGEELDPLTRTYIRTSLDRSRLRQRLTAAASAVFFVAAVAAGYFAWLSQERAFTEAQARTQAEDARAEAQDAAADAAAARDDALAAAAAEEAARTAEEAARIEAQNQAERAEQAAADAAEARDEAVAAAAAEAEAREQAEVALRTAMEAANSLVFDLAQQFATLSVPGSVIRSILQEARGLQDRLIENFPDDPDLQRSRAAAVLRLGDVYLFQDSLSDAMEAYQEVLVILRDLVARDPENAAYAGDLSLALVKAGDVHQRRGESDAALAAFVEALAITRTLVAAEPDETEWQRGMASSLSRIGAVHVRAGNIVEARAAFDERLVIARALVDLDADNATWQRDLMISLFEIGDLHMRAGNGEAALEAYEEALAISRHHAAAQPESTQWQRDITIALSKIARLLMAAGDPAGALTRFEEGLVILRALVESDPENTRWQRDLSLMVHHLGDARWNLGDGPGAITAYEEALEIQRGLVARDPSNAVWQRDVAVSLENIGDMRYRAGDVEAALAIYREALSIAESLVAQDPNDTESQRDVAVNLFSIGVVLWNTGDPAEALAAFEGGLAIARGLVDRDPENVQWRRDVEVFEAPVTEIQSAIAQAPPEAADPPEPGPTPPDEADKTVRLPEELVHR